MIGVKLTDPQCGFRALSIKSAKKIVIKQDGKAYICRGISTDIIEASAKAYIDAINRMVARIGQDDEPSVKVEL